MPHEFEDTNVTQWENQDGLEWEGKGLSITCEPLNIEVNAGNASCYICRYLNAGQAAIEVSGSNISITRHYSMPISGLSIRVQGGGCLVSKSVINPQVRIRRRTKMERVVIGTDGVFELIYKVDGIPASTVDFTSISITLDNLIITSTDPSNGYITWYQDGYGVGEVHFSLGEVKNLEKGEYLCPIIVKTPSFPDGFLWRYVDLIVI